MATHDHKGSTHPPIPLDGTITSSSDGSRPAGKRMGDGSHRRRPMAVIDHLSIPLISPIGLKTPMK